LFVRGGDAKQIGSDKAQDQNRNPPPLPRKSVLRRYELRQLSKNKPGGNLNDSRQKKERGEQ